MPRTSCSHKKCRLRTLVAALLAALAFAMLAGLGDDLSAHAQRAQRNSNAAQQKKSASTKRVFVGAGSSSAGGARQTIKSDNPLNDYSAYRSGDRFNVVIPNADANAIAKGGAGRGYTDMQVQQRGKDVVLTYKLQPGAKPRVEQKFNRLDVVFETPEGAARPAQTQTSAPANDPRTSAAQQNQTATRNAQTAAPSSTNNPASNRTQTPAANASAQSPNPSQQEGRQQQSASSPPATAQTAAEPQTAAPTTTATTNADAPAPAEAAQGQPAATPAEMQVAQARQPEPAAPGASTKAPATTAAPNATLGAALIRNWPVALALALFVGGLGLFFAARRSSAAVRTPPPVEEEARPAAVEKAKPVALEEAKPAPVAEATQTTTPPVEAALPAAAPTLVPVVLADTRDDAKETAKPQRARERGRKAKNKKAGKAKQKPEAPIVTADKADKPEAPPVASEDLTVTTPLVETPAVAPLVAASALAGATAASEESAEEETRSAPPVEVADTHAVEETVAARTEVEEAAVAAPSEETVVDEAAVETTVDEVAAVEEPAVEDAASEVAAVEETLVEEAAAEDVTAEEAVAGTSVVESAAVEDVVVEEAAAVETVAEETVVEEAAVVKSSTAEPSSVELAPVESSSVEPYVEAPPVEEVGEGLVGEAAGVVVPAAAAVTAIEAASPGAEAVPGVAADAEAVQAETKKLLDGERYDRGVLKSADMMARQMVAAELLSALSGRNPERRWRARTAFIEHGFFNESAHDLHYAEAPAERAAAARALALAGDRAATSHLAAALEDKDSNVRRAAVEALADLRDPAAVGALEELRERQKNYREKLPRRLLQHAIDACREGSAVSPAAPVSGETAETAAVETVAAAEESAEAPAFESPVAPAAEAAPVEASKEEAAVAEETEPVIEDAAAWFSVVSANDAPAVEETTAEETAVVERREEAAVAESHVVETREEAFVEKSVAPVVAEEEEARPAVAEVSPVEEWSFGEPRAEETSAIEPVTASPSFETVTAAPPEGEAVVAAESKEVEPVIEDAAAWYDLVSSGGAAAVEETRVEERAVEPRLYEPEEATLVAESEAPPAWAVESESATLESFDMPTEVGAKAVEPAAPAAGSPLGMAGEDWIELDVEETSFAPPAPPAVEAPPAQDAARYDAPTEIEARAPKPPPAPATTTNRFARQPETPARAGEEKGVELFDELSTVPRAIQQRITSADTSDRASALADLAHLDTNEAFHQICAAFDDDSREVRNAAARALFDLRPDRADSFTRALRESTPERRRNIGAAINNSGLAADAVGQLTGESREKTYEAFSLLFLMAKAGEVQPLLRAIETHPESEVRLAVVKLLALSGQKEILPAFRRLAVRGSLPTEVRSAVMEAIYQISSQDAHSAA